MVPLVGIGVVAAPSFRRSRAIVAESQEIDQRVIRLNALLELRYALTTELVPTEGLIRANEFGVNAEQASELLGFDVTSRLTASRITVDRILFDPAVRPMQFIDEIERSVVAARASVDDGTAVIDKVHQTYSEAIDALTEASSAELDETISASATSAGQVQGVEAAAFRLVGTFEFVRTGSDEVEALFQLTVLTTDADRRQLRDQLVALRSMYQRQLESMRRMDSPFGNMSVFENLVTAACFGGGQPEHEAWETAHQILQQTGLHPHANRPAGGLTLLDRKRLELARALATRPKLLLLDEIAGGLTEHEARELVSELERIKAQGVTMIWIEHVVHALLSLADRLFVINFGQRIAEGEPRAVMDDPEVRRVYMGLEV